MCSKISRVSTPNAGATHEDRAREAAKNAALVFRPKDGDGQMKAVLQSILR
jgi:hypothetical protein